MKIKTMEKIKDGAYRMSVVGINDIPYLAERSARGGMDLFRHEH